MSGSDFINDEAVAALIEECGLVPASLVTSSMIQEAKLSLRLRRENLSQFEKEVQDEFLSQFMARRRSRPTKDVLYPQLSFDFRGQ